MMCDVSVVPSMLRARHAALTVIEENKHKDYPNAHGHMQALK